MIEYVIHEMPDIRKTGKTVSYPRMVVKSNMTTEELVEKIAMPGSGVSRSSVVAVLMRLSEQMAMSLADGRSVTIEGVGTFTASLGYKEGREREDLTDEHAPNLNARSIEIDKVNFRVDPRLVNGVRWNCNGIKRRGELRLQKLKTTLQERIALAHEFLEQHERMTVSDYAAITSLRYHAAQRELKQLREDISSGICAQGRGVSLAYIKRK